MIRSTLFLLLLIINSSVVSSEEWKGCGLKSDPDMPLRIGTQSVVCLTLAPGGDWEDSTVVPARRYAFKAKTDDYSHLAIPGCECAIIEQNRLTVFEFRVLTFLLSRPRKRSVLY